MRREAVRRHRAVRCTMPSFDAQQELQANRRLYEAVRCRTRQYKSMVDRTMHVQANRGQFECHRRCSTICCCSFKRTGSNRFGSSEQGSIGISERSHRQGTIDTIRSVSHLLAEIGQTQVNRQVVEASVSIVIVRIKLINGQESIQENRQGSTVSIVIVQPDNAYR